MLLPRSTRPARLLSLVLLAGLAPSAAADLVTGRCVTDGGAGVGNLDIDVFLFSNGNAVTVSGDFTQPDGTFSMTVPPGTFTIEFKPSSASLFTKVVEPVTPGGTIDLGDVVIPKAATISGKVVNLGGNGVAGVNIDVVDAVTDISQPITGDVTPANGTFSIKVPVGLLEIQFEAPSTGTLLASEAIETTITKNTALGNIALKPGLMLTAKLERSNGNPVVNADTDVVDKATGDKLFTPGDNSKNDGSVSVVVPAGTYDFVAQPQFADGLVSVMVEDIVVNGAKDLGIVEHAAGVVLSGTVTSEGVALPDIDVDLNDPSDDSVVPLSMDNTDASGDYAIVVPTGTWDVTFSAVNGEALAPMVFRDFTISGNTTLDASLLPCTLPCAAPPSTTVLPGAGPPEGGNLVTLRGTDFAGNVGTEVLFGATPATVVSLTPPDTIVVQAPAGTKDTQVAVTVNDAGGSRELDDPYTYGDMMLELGHALEGGLPASDVDRIFVEAVAGSKVNLTVKAAKGSLLQPQLRVVAPDGSEVLSAADSVANAKTARGRKLLLGQTGLWTLELTGAAGTTGDYKLLTKVKTPKKLSAVATVDVGAPTATVSFGARPGWTLKKATVSSKKSKTVPFGPFPPEVALLDPSGDDVDLAGLTTTNKSGSSVKVSGVDFDAFGSWKLQVSSKDASTGQAKVVVAVKAPKTKKQTVVETP